MILYLLVPGSGKNYVLLLASLFFYAWGEPKYIFLMVATILVGYLSGRLIEQTENQKRKKLIMVISVVLCLGVLGIFKYADFFIDSFNKAAGQSLPFLRLALPIGISFYTFQLISYIVDVYRGNTEAQKDPIKLAVFICMFPQLIAGPIVRYVDVKDRLEHKTISRDKFSYGITRFCIGLGKKVLIANTLGELCAVYKGMATPTVLFTWMYALATTLQLYFDFSGYSDMAIGLGSMLGFDFPENFRHPLISTSATEFWRRWHITLGSWFRDYIYIPMGGNRVSRTRHLLNIAVVWMTTGLWHGANWNFVIWGVYFAILLIIEKYGLLKYLNRSKILSHIYLIFVVLISFIIFDNTVMAEGLRRIGYLFGAGGAAFTSPNTWFYLKDFFWILVLACIGATEIPGRCISRMRESHLANALNLAEPIFNAVLLILSTAFLINGSFNPFLYFRF